MKVWNWMRTAAVQLALAGVLLPAPGLLAQAPESAADAAGAGRFWQRQDVALQPGGILRGYVVDNAGRAAPAIEVQLFQNQQLVASGKSDDQGAFAIGQMRGGFYQLAAGDRLLLLRCWTEESAPPAARASTLLQITDVQRGQVHPGSYALASPWVITGVAIAVIAIPVALKANRDDRPNGSG